MRKPTIYILTNHTNSVLYTGVTSNLVKRIYQHKNRQIEGFSKKYDLYKLIYFEQMDDMENAISREKQIKKWSRKKKDTLINKLNPDRRDLYQEISA